MALLFNEEQQYIKDSAKDFVQKNAPRMAGTPFGMDFAENTRFHKHFHPIPTISEPSEPARGPPRASQIASRPGSAGASFRLRIMENISFYKGFYDFDGPSSTPPID